MNKKFLQTLMLTASILVTTSILSELTSCYAQIQNVNVFVYCYQNTPTGGRGVKLGSIQVPAIEATNYTYTLQWTYNQMINACYAAYPAGCGIALGCYADTTI